MICVDASLAAKWVLEEELSDRARALYRDMVHIRQSFVAPPLLPIEVSNIVRKKMRGPSSLSLADAIERLEDFVAIPIEIQNPAGLHVMALKLAIAYNLPATYDAHYVALAESLSCELWTDDRRLLQQVRSDLPFVRWIGDYREQ